MNIFSLMLLITLLTSCYLTTTFVLGLSADGLSLLSLKSAVDQSESDSVSYASVFSNWSEDDDTPCRWTGISCMNISGFREPRVVGISISSKNLRGYIPSELGALVYLRRLNLHDNNFYGAIPVPLFNATSLHSLFLYGNNFSGVLSPEICTLPRLQNLDLSNNSFTGVISKGFKKCKELQRFLIGNNKFYGEIPTGVWPVLENLVQLDLSGNGFSGSIPDDLGELKSLTGTLNLSYNHFTGKLPKSLANLPTTVSFDLRSNNFSGEIPQTGAFTNQGPTAFLNNPLLCGFPLQKPCGVSHESPSSRGQISMPGSDQTSPKKGLKPGLIILISVTDAAGVAFVGLVIVYIYWKKKDSDGCSCTGKEKLGGNGNGNPRASMCPCICARGGFSANDSEADQSDKESSSGGGGNGGNRGDGNLVAIDKGFSFELDELLRASAYVLGKSGLGIVYKVVLGNGVPVAVRRLGEGGEHRYKEFTSEIQAIGKVKHPNVVKLRAYYWAPDEKLLISDFISNGNLASALRGRNGQASTSLSWAIRLKIAKGTARGLAYLHECSPRKFVHGNIKPSNILLSNDFQAHVSDFGLTRLISITGNNNNNPSSSSGGGKGGFMGAALPYMMSSSISSQKINSYRSPESRVTGNKPTQKWDVYSFGVVLLELVTGKSPDLSPNTSSSASYSVEVMDLVSWVRKGFEEEKALSDMVDPMVLQEADAKKQVLAVFHVALACTEADPEMRPRMKSVAENLDRI